MNSLTEIASKRDMTPLVTRAMRLRLLRTARGLGVAELSTKASVSPATLNNLEADRYGGRPATIYALADALEVSRDALDDDLSCFRELARVCGVELPSAPTSVPQRVSELLERAGPARAAHALQILEGLLALQSPET